MENKESGFQCKKPGCFPFQRFFGAIKSALFDDTSDSFEEDFTEDDGYMETDIDATRIDRSVYNEDTVDYVLQDVMQHGIRLAGGDKLAKTINSVFADKKFHIVFACFRDKNLERMLAHVGEITNQIILTSFPHERCRNEEDYFLFLSEYEK